MRRFWCVLIALMMLAAGCTALAEDTGVWEFDTFDYVLEGYNGPGGDVVIPDMIDGCTVDIIGLNFFNSNEDVTSLVLPDSVRQIEAGAIAYCSNMTSLELNDGLVIIDDNCFTGNDVLQEVTIPASVSYIGNACFVDNACMEKVTFLGKCPVFEGASFEWTMEDLIIYVPDDEYDAYAAAFANMGLEAELQMSGSNAEIVDFTGDPSLFGIYDDGTIYCYEGYDVRVDIPAEIDGIAVKAIGEDAFNDHRYICYLTLPEGVESIGDRAFESCNNLLYIDFPSTLKTIGERSFADGLPIRSLNLPESLETIGTEAFDGAYHIIGAMHLPEGLKVIGDRAFANCSWLEEVYIPGTVEVIGEEAFDNSGMNYLAFEGAKMPEIADSAFANCTYLADIDLHTTATKQEMLGLQAVVDTLGLECRVWRMQNPDVAYIEDGLDIYENGVMTAYTGEQSHVRPWDAFDEVDVTAIGNGVFRNSTTIEYFAVPYNDVFTTIGEEAFAGSSLRKVDLFDSVTTIADGAFSDCANLESPNLPESLTLIGNNAFSNCTAIDKIVLPESLEIIGSGAFSGCTGVEELVLPASLEAVGSGAISGCTNLKKLIVLCDAAILPDDVLAGCPEDMEIYAAETADAAQLKHLSALAGRAWNFPVTRIGEPLPEIVGMPYEPLPIDDFWYDTEFARLDNYEGYERNLVLPGMADGVQLTMIGGSVMTRASYGDNYEVELPAVSLVIPETYTEIVPYAFANCETLETVICYAPIELLPDCAFQNCTSLREVIFVNGVREIGANVFDNCPNLKTVYIGNYTETISESAFMDCYGETIWALDQCITDPAKLPDIDALLAAVKMEPMPTPTPRPTPVPAVPVGEEGEAFVGVWHGTEMDMGGEIIAMADWDMAMTLVLCEDGRALMSDEADVDLSLATDEDWASWRVENGVAYCDQSALTIEEDGRLCLNEEGMKMYFVKGEDAGTSAAEPVQAVPVGEEGLPFVGLWNGTEMDMAGEVIAMADWEMAMTLVLCEDGRALMSDEPEIDFTLVTDEDWFVWRVEEGVAYCEQSAMMIGEDGRLCMEEEGLLIYFEKSEEVLEIPAAPAAPANPTAAPVKPAPSKPAPVTSSQGGRTGVKYVCVNADVDSYVIDASMLGGEYSLVFNDNGTADFVVVGSPMPALNWVMLDNGNFQIDYFGTKMEIVWTDAGFDMNYFDTMMMHFVPEK